MDSDSPNRRTVRRFPPPITVRDGVGYIPLNRGLIGLVDEQDIPIVDGQVWTAVVLHHSGPYIHRRIDGATIYLHRLLMNLTRGDGLFVDHRNGDGLDNRRTNLRLVNRSQNAGNGISRHGASRFKGVVRHRDVWLARIAREHLGTFDTEDEAARAYDVAAWAKWGDYARLNFPDGLAIEEV